MSHAEGVGLNYWLEPSLVNAEPANNHAAFHMIVAPEHGGGIDLTGANDLGTNRSFRRRETRTDALRARTAGLSTVREGRDARRGTKHAYLANFSAVCLAVRRIYF